MKSHFKKKNLISDLSLIRQSIKTHRFVNSALISGSLRIKFNIFFLNHLIVKRRELKSN